MEDYYQFFVLIPQLIGSIGSVLIFGASIYAVTRQPSVPTGLMAFGGAARLACGLFFTFGISFFNNDYERYSQVGIPFQVLSYLGAIAFIVGFFLFAYKFFSTPPQV